MVDAKKLATVIMEGRSTEAVEIAFQLLQDGLPIEIVIELGLTYALRSLDMKCTNDEFNLLEILLAGRAVMSVMNALQARGYLNMKQVQQDTIVLGTIQGDIHDLGKNIVKIIFTAAGFRVIDLGTDVPPQTFVTVAQQEQASWIGVSTLICTTFHTVREIKPLAQKLGLKDVKVIAGGGAVQQCCPEDLNVDLIAGDVFTALRLCTAKGVKL
ncbi:Glutamate mutase sigma subunit [Neomoorella glycerini]|uniref:Glutamate mutase sigma subunit n=2 Tax=Neomoorella glycerini TaxID=55779 RepID=A0A6I5ZMD5_9FIRM|nr:Glutamate mutase sigma subunit [Moorella glycerini]